MVYHTHNCTCTHIHTHLPSLHPHMHTHTHPPSLHPHMHTHTPSLHPHMHIHTHPLLTPSLAQLHSKNCELVTIECPHACNFSCQRKDLSSHIFICPNKPQQCPTCSVFFPKNKRGDHAPYCSKIMLPESVQSTLFKVNNFLMSSPLHVGSF